ARGRRPSTTVQNAASTADPASTPPAAPVAPYSAPSASTAGTSTATSSSWPAVRRPGRPIDTGKLFVHANTSCSTAARSITRNAGTAGTYFEPYTHRTSVDMKIQSGGVATSASAA